MADLDLLDSYKKQIRELAKIIESLGDCISREAAIQKMLELEREDIDTYGCKIPECFDGERAAAALTSMEPFIKQKEVQNENLKRQLEYHNKGDQALSGE